MTIPNTITYTNTSGEENKLSVYAGALTGVVEGWMRTVTSVFWMKTLLVPDLTAFDVVILNDTRLTLLVGPSGVVGIAAAYADTPYVESWLRYQLAEAHGMNEELELLLTQAFRAELTKRVQTEAVKEKT